MCTYYVLSTGYVNTCTLLAYMLICIVKNILILSVALFQT